MSFVRPVRPSPDSTPVDVDILASEKSVSVEVDTSSQSPPVTVLAPSPGKRISVRSVFMSTDSSGGSARLMFRDSGRLVAVMYCVRQSEITAIHMNFLGDPDEPIVLDWSGLSSGARVFVAISYKEV